MNSKNSGDLPAVEKISLNNETKTKSNTNDDGMIYS
jgi:hypothetical protein